MEDPKEVQIALFVKCDKETAQKLANEAQQLIDIYGYDVFFKGLDFMKTHPDIFNMALKMIGYNKQ